MRRIFELNKWLSLFIAIAVICVCIVVVLLKTMNKAPDDITIVTYKQVISEKITLFGELSPHKQQHISAPFNGTIVKKLVSTGDVVKQGDEIIIFDSLTLKSKIRESEVNVIKAQKRVSKLDNWHNSQEVNSVKRTIAKTKKDFIFQKEKVEKAQNLFNIGVVSENEYKGELARLEQMKIELLSNEESLTSILQQGSEEELTVARLELSNAVSELEQLKEQLLKRKIKADFDGIVISEGEDDGEFKKVTKIFSDGDNIKENQQLLMLADQKSFKVIGKLDEIYLKSLRIGDSADIFIGSNDEIQLKGLLVNIGFKAEQKSFDEQSHSKFPFTISIDNVPNEYSSNLRFGMSVKISFEKNKNPSAIVIPHSAIAYDDNGAFVYVLNKEGSKEARAVETGISVFDGVEVLSGLEENEKVVINQ